MSQGLDRGLYHRRNLVETAFSVLKRRYGENLKARKHRNLVKEIKLVIYNTISIEQSGEHLCSFG